MYTGKKILKTKTRKDFYRRTPTDIYYSFDHCDVVNVFGTDSDTVSTAETLDERRKPYGANHNDLAVKS